MRIGILTIQKSHNYGANLQCFALYEFIHRLGHDVEVIDLHRPGVHEDYVTSSHFTRHCKPSRFATFKSVFRKVFPKRLKRPSPSELSQARFEDFWSLMQYSKAYNGPDALYNKYPVYDIYITGSDQVWNPSMRFFMEPYFLTFAPLSAKRISYAASIGVSTLPDAVKTDYAEWLSHFHSISVREQTAKAELTSFLRKDVEVVCDPSFLLDRSEWEKVAVVPLIKRKYLLLFTLSYSRILLDYALRIGKECGLEVVYLCRLLPIESLGYICERDAGPREFLGYICNASFVLTDSFHGTVFSIIMGTNFCSYIRPDNKRGSRIVDLLYKFRMGNHLLHSDLSQTFAELQEINLTSDMNILTEVRREGEDFLLRSIKNNNGSSQE